MKWNKHPTGCQSG